ncbi:hypothetical protein KQX54_011493 [Cotesia glomerata]|uniref:HTH CENPB-type domain-containing protein n=1 Tax=Cotesia glomerata TaxID=32391 RepID=A0AAV7J3E6_COTGL|nr:hypothetical protein KQX54_011493 [Cotesia glomerata]
MDWYREMGPSYPFRACNSWVKYFQRTHKIKVTFQGIKNEEEEYKVDNQSKNKDEKSTVLDQEATMNEKNEENKELIKEKEKFFLKLFLSPKIKAVGREEKVKQGIQKDVEKKNSKEINVNIVEVLNQPIYKKNVEYFENEDDIETTSLITDNKVSLFGIIEDKKEEKKVLAQESNKSLKNDFAYLNYLNGETNEKEFLRNQCDFFTTSEHSTKNVNDKKQVSLVNVGLQTSDVLTQTEKIKRDKEINKTQVEIQEVKMEANKEVKEKVNNVIGFKSKYDERKELEQILLNWLSEIRSQRLEINGRKFREKALELHNSLNHRYDFRAQYHWIASFEKRYQVQVISRPRKYKKRTRGFLKDLDSFKMPLMRKKRDALSHQEIGIKNCEQDKIQNRDKKDKKILELPKQCRGESISSEDKNSNSESISLTSKSVIQCHGKVSGIEEEIGEKSSSIVGLDGESVRNCDLASIRDSDSSSSLLKSHLQFGVNNIEIKEPLELFDKGLIREEKVSREVEDDWIDEVIETAKEEGEYWDWERAVHNQITQILVELEDSKLEEEIGRKELKNRQTENIEMRDSEEEATEVSGCGIGEVKARDEEEKLKEEIDEIKECEEDEVDTEDENNYSVSYNLLKRSDGSEKLVLDKSKEERNFDEKMQVDADDIKEENLTDEQVKVNARDEEEKLKEEIDEIKECEEDEVDTEDDENYDSVSYNLLKRSDVSEKLVLDKSKEERNFDEKMQVDADDMKEENLTEEQVKVNKENLATNGEEKGKDEEVEVEDEDDDSCDLFIDLNVSENLIVNETDEEKEVQGKNVNLATMEVFGDEIEEIEKKIMVIECEEEVENVFKEQEVKLGEKDLVTNVEEDQESIGEEEEEENIRNEVKNLDAMGNEENEMIIVEDEVENLEIEENEEEIEEQYLQRKNKTLKQVTFATDVKIINAHHLPTNCPSLESSTFKPVNINMKEYVKILEYKLVFSKCQQFIKDQNIRQYFKRQQIKEFKRAIDVLIDKATSEDDLLDNLLMNKNWAPFGRMFCSEDIARVCEGKIICTFCYKDDKDEYKNYFKSSINHKLTSNKKLRGRICDKCKESTVDFRPAAKCIECIIPFWRSKSYYKLLYCNKIGNLEMTSEQLLLINSILTNMHDFEC